MEIDIFEACHSINDLLIENQEHEARNELIKLLDYHETNNIKYSELVNHLIRESGLYPYLETETANWQDRYIPGSAKHFVSQHYYIALSDEINFRI